MKTINEQILPEFINQAKKLTQLAHFLRPILPEECYQHIQVANIRQQKLMLITDSPVWTTRLRQLSPKILQYIQENNQEFAACFNDRRNDDSSVKEQYTRNDLNIHHIQISTRYHKRPMDENPSTTKASSIRPTISEKTARLLSQSAESIEHPGLKSALLKLAQHNDSDVS